MEWEPINHTFTDPPIEYFNGYVYYFNDIPRDEMTCCNASGQSLGIVSFNLSNPDKVSISGDWDNTFISVTITDELNSAALCDILFALLILLNFIYFVFCFGIGNYKFLGLHLWPNT